MGRIDDDDIIYCLRTDLERMKTRIAELEAAPIRRTIDERDAAVERAEKLAYALAMIRDYMVGNTDVPLKRITHMRTIARKALEECE